LTGLAIHAGSMGYGHYVAFAKREENWYYFDDEDVKQVPYSTVMNREAYLLFYVRKD
jgi:ubiquitin C-terminal hydrolase